MGGKAGSTESAVPVAGDLTKDETPQPIADTPVVSAATRDARRHMAAELEIIDAEMYEITFEPSLLTRLARERENDEQLLDLIIDHVVRHDAVALGPVIAKALLSRGSCDRGFGMLRNHGHLDVLSRTDVFTPELLREAVLIGATAPFSLRLSSVLVGLYANASTIEPTEIAKAIAELTAHRSPSPELPPVSYSHVALDLLTSLIPRMSELNGAAPADPGRFRRFVESVISYVRDLPDDLRVEPTGRLVGALTAADQLNQLTSYACKHIDEINDPRTWRPADVFLPAMAVQDEALGIATHP